MKCGAQVEFRPAVVASTELQFHVEAWFAGEKIGKGTGKTRREAHYQAAEGSLKNLANIYLSRIKPDSVSVHGDMNKFPNVNSNGFEGNLNSFGIQPFPKEESLTSSTSSEPSRPLDPRLEGSKKSMSSVSTLKELKPVIVLDLLWNLAFVCVGFTVMGLSMEEKPVVPLRIWVVGYILQCLYKFSEAVHDYSNGSIDSTPKMSRGLSWSVGKTCPPILKCLLI